MRAPISGIKAVLKVPGSVFAGSRSSKISSDRECLRRVVGGGDISELGIWPRFVGGSWQFEEACKPVADWDARGMERLSSYALRGAGGGASLCVSEECDQGQSGRCL